MMEMVDERTPDLHADERTFAFIEPDASGERMCSPVPSDTEHPLRLAQRRGRVRFEVAFNVRGPLSVNVAAI